MDTPKPMVRVVATHDRVVDEHRMEEINQLRWLPVGESRLVPRSPTTRKALRNGKLLPCDEACAKWAGLDASKLKAAQEMMKKSEPKASKSGGEK